MSKLKKSDYRDYYILVFCTYKDEVQVTILISYRRAQHILEPYFPSVIDAQDVLTNPAQSENLLKIILDEDLRKLAERKLKAASSGQEFCSSLKKLCATQVNPFGCDRRVCVLTRLHFRAHLYEIPTLKSCFNSYTHDSMLKLVCN